MSHLVQEWAEDHAPVADTYERVILMLLARRATDDGTGAYAPVSSLAVAAVCDTETAQRCLQSLTERGLIASSSQQLAGRVSADERPHAYDVLVPCDWYSPQQLAEINRGRIETGQAPITPENRPSIAGGVTE